MTNWYGIDKYGNQIQVSHKDFMSWAYRNEKQITVGWSNYYQFPDDIGGDLSGARLVRGKDIGAAAKTAEELGWKDLRDQLLVFAVTS